MSKFVFEVIYTDTNTHNVIATLRPKFQRNRHEFPERGDTLTLVGESAKWRFDSYSTRSADDPDDEWTCVMTPLQDTPGLNVGMKLVVRR